MQATIKRWGNTAAVRIPAAVLQMARLSCDQLVQIHAEAGRIVIEPVRCEAYQLADLLSRITEDNLHGGMDFGPPVGRERL